VYFLWAWQPPQRCDAHTSSKDLDEALRDTFPASDPIALQGDGFVREREEQRERPASEDGPPGSNEWRCLRAAGRWPE